MCKIESVTPIDVKVRAGFKEVVEGEWEACVCVCVRVFVSPDKDRQVSSCMNTAKNRWQEQ